MGVPFGGSWDENPLLQGLVRSVVDNLLCDKLSCVDVGDDHLVVRFLGSHNLCIKYNCTKLAVPNPGYGVETYQRVAIQ